MDRSKEPRLAPLSFDREHYPKYLLILIVLLCLYGIMVFFFDPTIHRIGVIATIIGLAERISKIIPLGIILVIIVEGVNRKMLAAIEDFREWRKSREAWIRKRIEEAHEEIEAARKEASEAAQKEASEAAKKEIEEAQKEASEALQKEASTIFRQELLRLAEKQQRYQDDMKSWADRRLAAERRGEPFDEPMPAFTIAADDLSD